MLKLVVISPSTANLDAIGAMLRKAGFGEQQLVLVEGGMSKLLAVAEREQPDVVLLDSMCRDLGELRELDALTARRPQTVAIMLCANQTPEFLIQAMRAGVREVLSSPITAEALLPAVERARQKIEATVATPTHAARILAFIPCKGGSGATFIAANVAFQLSMQGSSVLLVDLNLQFGDALLFLHDQKPRCTLADVARNMERLDASFLDACLVRITPQLGVLAAPEDPAQAIEVRPEHVETLLNIAAARFDFIVLDIGRILDAVSIRALDRAHAIYPVLQLTLPFVRDAHRLLSMFQALGYAKDKVSFIVNRYERGSEITLDDLRRTLGCERPHVLPNSYAAVAASVNHGRPIAEVARNNPVTRALGDLVAAQAPSAEPQGGWIGRLLGREWRA